MDLGIGRLLVMNLGFGKWVRAIWQLYLNLILKVSLTDFQIVSKDKCFIQHVPMQSGLVLLL